MSKIINKFMMIMAIFAAFATSSFGSEMKTDIMNIYPKSTINNDGSRSGFCIELMELVSKDTGIKFVHSSIPRPLKRIVSNLKKGSIDVYFGLKKNKKRESIILFSEPLYEVSILVLGKRDDNLIIESWEDLYQLSQEDKVLARFGTGISRKLKKNKKLVVDDGGKTPDANIIKLLKGRGRVYVEQNIGLHKELLESTLENGKLKVLGKSINPFSHHLVFSKKADPELIRKVSESVKKLKKTEEWIKILKRYLE